jgi:hypothetical protein
VLAVDGKAMRATLRGADPVHLPAVLDHATSIVLAQVNVDAKTNEIPCLRTVLDQITDLKDILITADALCRRRHNASYADPAVMPTGLVPCLVGGLAMSVMSA